MKGACIHFYILLNTMVFDRLEYTFTLFLTPK